MFFVGTKSVFNKTDPKIGFNEEMIDIHYEGVLNKILKQCYNQLIKLPIEGVIQGDLLYTETPSKVVMCGKPCYKFKPNTITYCVESNTDMGKKVGNSKLGIVFHTTYGGGDTITESAASFAVLAAVSKTITLRLLSNFLLNSITLLTGSLFNRSSIF